MVTSIPNDTRGNPIQSGRRYVLEGKGVKPVKVVVSYDETVGSLAARRADDNSIVVWKEEDNQVNPLTNWRRVPK